MKLQAASVEKDFWVCWILRELAEIPGLGAHISFKGGTSLSKAWKLIERFSEDIDMVADREALDIDKSSDIPRDMSANRRRKYLESLSDACRRWVQGPLMASLTERIGTRIGAPGRERWSLAVDPDVDDGQCLLFHYSAAFRPDEAGYVRPVVKIEFGARSEIEPSSFPAIKPYLAEALPEIMGSGHVAIRTVAAVRTFWEKVTLLHEETYRPEEKPRRSRMARHYYDLWCLIRRGIADEALKSPDLFDRVVEHRRLFFRMSWVDYSTLRRGALRLVPHQADEGYWREDYRKMHGPMFFGETPTFDEILRVVGEFQESFNRSGNAEG